MSRQFVKEDYVMVVRGVVDPGETMGHIVNENLAVSRFSSHQKSFEDEN